MSKISLWQKLTTPINQQSAKVAESQTKTNAFFDKVISESRQKTDDLNTKRAKYQAERAKYQAEREKYTLEGKYFGTHPKLPQPYKNLFIGFSDNGIQIRDKRFSSKKRTPLKTFSWAEIKGYEPLVDVNENGGKRITATRMIAIGIFAVATPKGTRDIKGKIYQVLHTTTGDVELEQNMDLGGSSTAQMIFETEKRKQEKLRFYVAEQLAKHRQPDH